MTHSNIIAHRLFNQQIATTKFKTPQEIVQWMVAMQAQEYAAAKWAIGLRLPDSTDAIVEKAFNDGAILRTHLLRPTWHFVHPSDIRWLITLTAPRVKAASTYMNNKLGLTAKIFRRSNDIISKLLEGGKQLSRPVIKEALHRARIKTDENRLSHLLFAAELDAIICSGPREGRQFTYALLEERVPEATSMERDEALAALTRRYFASRGPATMQDFVWWSGLTVKDAREGIAMLPSGFAHETIKGKEYYFKPVEINTKKDWQTTFLLPDYDEYGIGYKDRSILLDPKKMQGSRNGNPIFSSMIVIDGVMKGTWKRTVKNEKINMETTLFNSPGKTKEKSVRSAVKRYIQFIETSKTKNEA